MKTRGKSKTPNWYKQGDKRDFIRCVHNLLEGSSVQRRKEPVADPLYRCV